MAENAEDIISAQKELAEEISRQLRNFKKDGAERKTEEYLTRRLKDIERLWSQFTHYHIRLLGAITDEHPYFTEKLYEQTNELYKKAVETISSFQTKASAGNIQASGNKGIVDGISPSQITPPVIIQDQPMVHKPQQQQLMMNNTREVPQQPAIQNQWQPSPAMIQPHYDTNRLNSLPKLPAIKIPKFTGDYKDWKSFIDIFTNVIHDNVYLTNVEKMQYLLCHLEGDAKRVISHLQLNNNNYNTALQLISARFNNNRKIITTYVNTIIDAKKTEHRCQEDIIMLYDLIRECLEALKNLNCNTDEWGPMMVCIAMRKLDTESLRLFEESLTTPREMPSVEEFLKFLEKRYQVLDSIKGSKFQKPEPAVKNSKRNFHAAVRGTCAICSKAHSTYQCAEFKRMNVQDRNVLVRQKNLCANCLAHNKTERCKSNKTCIYCKKRHHSLLHQYLGGENKFNVKPTPSTDTKQQQEDDATVCHTNSKKVHHVLLPTAVVSIKNIYGQTEQLRALIDPGSQVNLITEESVQMLKLQKERIRATILGVGEAETAKSNSKVNIKLKLKQQGIHLSIEAFVLPRLNSYLPDMPLKGIDMDKYNNIVLADPNFGTPGPIDLLLGAGVYANIISDGIKEGQPTAQNTKLGWILFGTIPNGSQETTRVSSFLSLAEIDKKLEEFWDIRHEEDTNEDEVCEENFKTTFKRDNEGRYIVRLPFKNTSELLGNSRNVALARLLQVEQRLRKNSDDQIEYNTFLAEYLALGHMSPAKSYKGAAENVYYLPHHAVHKKDSTTTKLRVVFDASCKSQSGLSLNELLHTGPKIQQNLSDILLRWRKHRHVYTADIEKMFRQVIVAKEDRNYQRILWRPRPNEPVQEFTLNTLTYGTGPATYLSLRVLKQLAKDEGDAFPIGKKVLASDFYIDDLLTGADTTAEAQELQGQITELLRKGGFNLRKWTSNNKELLKNIPMEAREEGILEIKEHDTIKALGVHWNPTKDEFQFRLKHDNLAPNTTKRMLLSRIASIFDPLGHLAPVLMRAKIIMQSLWKIEIDWDEKAPPQIVQAWEEIESELHKLQDLKIPRWIGYRKRQEIELHGFCDASEKGYAAVIYARTIDSFGRICTRLLTSKTKVTPLKQKITIPRLELCGALLLAQLLKSTIAVLELETPSVYAWCDSEIVLAWILKNPNTLNSFIAHRTSEIQNAFSTNIWRHVSSNENPADIASRGTSPSTLVSHNMWWRGPRWLSHHPDAWPLQKVKFETDEEAKRTATRALNTTLSSMELFTCSTLTRQIRAIAYCQRFIANCKVSKSERKLQELTAEELEHSKDCIIKIIQGEAFSDDIERLRKNKPLAKSSKILSLGPFLDNKGILRVGGRIKNSALSEDAKHQILLPQKNHVTNLIIENAHQQTLHGGTQLTLNYIRAQYWIINAKSRVQSRIHRCIKCLRHAQNPVQPLMGDLPAIRITPSPPFSHCGVDYAGPFLTKFAKGRGTKAVKGYIALFICMVTKAVHLELVSDLTTDAFLAAYKRFVARRGNCRQIYSDNGTNFVGAKRRLDKDLQNAIAESTKRAAEVTANDGTEWKFIPPATPHLGGLWEAGVKSVKGHLKRVLSETLLTYEEFSTVLSQVEACLNSRPIGQQSSDPKDLEPLTPGHFLIGRPLLAPPQPDMTNQVLYERWKMVTKLYQHIWKRWSEEYLNLLQQRSKWTTQGKNPTVGELVIIKDDTLPPQKWSLGRIVQLHPGEDGIVRIVSVRHKNDIKKRPVNKLCQLPISILSTDNEDPEVKATTALSVLSKPSKRTISQSCEDDERDISNSIVRDRDQGPSNKKRKVRIAPCTWAGNLLQTTLLILYWITVVFGQGYEIIHPKNGFYIENLGYAKIKRGNLRLQISLPIDEIINDQEMINSTWTQINQMCAQTRKLTEIAHCDTFFKHLSVKRHNLLEAAEEIQQLLEAREEIQQLLKHKNRSKRGLLGKLLTSIFGVNDDVYKEIESLQSNQHTIAQFAGQQAIYVNSKINQTTFAIEDKLKQFDVRLSKVIDSINDMATWYSQADHNRISIEVLAAYLSAEDYFNELERKYDRWRNAIHAHAHILDFITPYDVKKTIENVSNRIDSNLFIIKTPQRRLDVRVENDTLRLYGYLNIVERSTFALIHVTPIPHLIGNNSLAIAELTFLTLAINFNEQTYFNLEQGELKSCLLTGNYTYICMPTMVHSIDGVPSCVIDEIYDRHPKTTCKIKHMQLNGMIWKALMMKNTWLYVTTEPKVIAIICKGVRRELLLNTTGILRLDDDCIINSKETTLKTTIDESIEVISSHVKEADPILPKINYSKPFAILRPGVLIAPNEHICDYSIEPDLPSSLTLHKITLGSVATSTSIIVILLLYICIRRYWSKIKAFFNSCQKARPESTLNKQSTPNIDKAFDRVLGSAARQHVQT